MKKYFLFFILVFAAAGVSAQFPFGEKKVEKDDRLDSLLTMLRGKKSKIRGYDKVITPDAVTHRGLFAVHEVRDSIFWEIPDTLLDRRLVMIKRLVKGNIPGGLGG